MTAKRTTEEFVVDAEKVHSGRYDYSRVEYVNSHNKVAVVCPDHGEFLITPTNHLRGKGCKPCGLERRRISATKPFDKFLAEARVIHGDKYQYNKDSYRNARTKMRIICPIHGEFIQEPMVHLQGSGCNVCGNEKASQARSFTQEKFDQLLTEKYGVRIQAVYLGMHESMVAQCAKHGEFKTTAFNLLYSKHGCHKCAHAANAGGTKLSKEEVLERLTSVFGDQYDYTNVKYHGSKKHISLVCPKHGKFRKFAEAAFAGQGCPKCSKIASEDKRLKNLRANFDASRQRHYQNFLEKACEVHGNFFNYSKVSYVNQRTAVIIICPKHGDFSQPPTTHLNAGCRQCADEELKGRYTDKYFKRFPEERDRTGTLYYILIAAGDETFYKVGITVTTVQKRFANLRGLGGKVKLLASNSNTLLKAYEAEKQLLDVHVKYYRYRPKLSEAKRGSVVGASECFNKALPPRLVNQYYGKQ